MAEPIRARATAFWTEITNTCIIAPMPMPAITMARRLPVVVSTSIRQSSAIPSASTSGPSTTFQR